MTDYYDDVREFHEKNGVPHHPDERPHLLSADEQEFRVKFLREELDEFADAHAQGRLADAADALVDLAVVCLGTAHMMGVPFGECWDAVHAANMTKVRATGDDDPRSKRGSGLDIVKPAGFRPPDHRPALEAARLAWLQLQVKE